MVVTELVLGKGLSVVRHRDLGLVFLMVGELEVDHACLMWWCLYCLEIGAGQLGHQVAEVEGLDLNSD